MFLGKKLTNFDTLKQQIVLAYIWPQTFIFFCTWYREQIDTRVFIDLQTLNPAWLACCTNIDNDLTYKFCSYEDLDPLSTSSVLFLSMQTDCKSDW